MSAFTEAIQLDQNLDVKDRGSWADWTEEMDKTSEVSSIHTETGLTNNHTTKETTKEKPMKLAAMETSTTTFRLIPLQPFQLQT